MSISNKTATPARLANSVKYWEPIKLRIRDFLERGGKGAAAFMARKLGVDNSQIHRWSCAKCEHDAEPVYSTGIAILLFLNEYEHLRNIKEEIGPRKPTHRKGCSLLWRRLAHSRRSLVFAASAAVTLRQYSQAEILLRRLQRLQKSTSERNQKQTTK